RLGADPRGRRAVARVRAPARPRVAAGGRAERVRGLHRARAVARGSRGEPRARAGSRRRARAVRVPPSGRWAAPPPPRQPSAVGIAWGETFSGRAPGHARGAAPPAPRPPYRAGVERHYLPFELWRAGTVVGGTPQPGFPGPWPDKGAACVEWLFVPTDGLVGK